MGFSTHVLLSTLDDKLSLNTLYSQIAQWLIIEWFTTLCEASLSYLFFYFLSETWQSLGKLNVTIIVPLSQTFAKEIIDL